MRVLERPRSVGCGRGGLAARDAPLRTETRLARAIADALARSLARSPGPRPHPQGWYSQEYDDAWPAPTLVYDAADVPSGSAFVWLIVPQSARGPCADSAVVTSVSASAVAVRATVGGVQHGVTVPIA